jgi:integrase/recombinase XerD
MSIPEAIAAYLEELRRRNYAARTLEEYGYDLGFLRRFLDEKKIVEVQAVTSTVLSDYQRWLFYQPIAGGTVRSVVTQNKMLAPVKGLCRFLTVEGILVRNPSRDLEYGREPRRLPRNILTPREAKRILDTIDTTHVRGYRARTILEVLYATGIRRSELINLRLSHVNLDDELLTVHQGKGGHDRVVPLSAVACRFLETYLKGIRPRLAKSVTQDHLFLSSVGKALDKDALNYLVKLHTRKAGLKKHVTCHVWRHTCATHLVQNNANLRHVQEMLGHRSLATTERYLQLTVADLKKAHRKFHPREKA